MKRRFLLLAFGPVFLACHVGRELPLFTAARAGDLDAIRRELSAGADPDARDGAGNGWTPLLHAVHKNQKSSVTALLDAGASVNATGQGGLTPLIMAAGYGQTEMVRLLLTRGADPNLADAHGRTALSAAITGVADIDCFTLGQCQKDTVRAILEVAPRARITERAKKGSSLVIARIGGCSDVLGAH